MEIIISRSHYRAAVCFNHWCGCVSKDWCVWLLGKERLPAVVRSDVGVTQSLVLADRTQSRDTGGRLEGGEGRDLRAERHALRSSVVVVVTIAVCHRVPEILGSLSGFGATAE